MGIFAKQAMPYLRLRREIVWTLVVKLLALIVIYNSFFNSAHKAKITPSLLNQHLLNLSVRSPERNSRD